MAKYKTMAEFFDFDRIQEEEEKERKNRFEKALELLRSRQPAGDNKEEDYFHYYLVDIKDALLIAAGFSITERKNMEKKEFMKKMLSGKKMGFDPNGKPEVYQTAKGTLIQVVKTKENPFIETIKTKRNSVSNATAEKIGHDLFKLRSENLYNPDLEYILGALGNYFLNNP